MPRLRFVLFDMLGATLWVSLYVGLGYVLHDQLMRAAVLAQRLGGWALVIAAGLLVLYLGIKMTRRHLFLRRLRIARISPEELHAKLLGGEPVLVVDLRHDLDVQAAPTMIRGAVRVTPAALEEGRLTIPRDREMVLYCT